MTTWNLNQMQRHLLICNGATCMSAGAEEVTQQIRDEIRKNRLDEMIHTSRTRCNGRCKDKCVVIDYPKGTWYSVQNEETSRARSEERRVGKECRCRGSASHYNQRWYAVMC